MAKYWRDINYRVPVADPEGAKGGMAPKLKIVHKFEDEFLYIKNFVLFGLFCNLHSQLH